MLSVAEVGKILRMSPASVHRLIKAGKLPAEDKVGGRPGSKVIPAQPLVDQFEREQKFHQAAAVRHYVDQLKSA